MCMSIPGKLIKVDGNKAIVQYDQEDREVTLLDPEIKEGDFVVVQNKLIMQKVPEKEALESIKVWKKALNLES
ncbi:HypC/HybG/HupF family hydrogenase formation chaperone [Candidatus Woesearchaeota archaeon]|nr:HypC/HybG/HupF family hydrogenase formation chaperone [Candidatus Woesearchaeota archaeon]